MPRNGAGTYTPPAGQPVASGTTVSSSVFNALVADLGVELTKSVCTDGQTPMAANLPMGANKITNLAAGTLASDAVRKDQVPSLIDLAGPDGVLLVGNATDKRMLASNAGAAALGDIAPGANSVSVTVAKKIHLVIDLIDTGGIAGNAATNLAALRKAITDVNTAGGGEIRIPYGYNYGYQRSTKATWPLFLTEAVAATQDIIIYDASLGATYGAGSSDGSQTRVWYITNQANGGEGAGQHDGNTSWHRGRWAPTRAVSNDSGIADPSVGALDNRRASDLYCVDGVACWQIGQGLTTTGAGKTQAQLTDFALTSYGHAGSAMSVGTNIFGFTKTNGNAWFGADLGDSFTFLCKAAGNQLARLKSATGQIALMLQNAAGSYLRLTSRAAGGVDIDVNGSGGVSIDENRQVLLGLSSAATTAPLQVSQATAANGAMYLRNADAAAGTHYLMLFAGSSGTVGSISHNLTTTTYATSSDYRLKENGAVADQQSGTNRIMRIRIKDFNFKATPGTVDRGVFAHELQEIIPGAVTGQKDGTRPLHLCSDEIAKDREGEPIILTQEPDLPALQEPAYQGVDYSACVPDLILALQHLRAEFDAYKTAHQ